jgi:hypothetical protein
MLRLDVIPSHMMNVNIMIDKNEISDPSDEITFHGENASG